MKKYQTQTIETRHYQLLGLIFASVFLLGLYLIFIGRVVTITVARQEALKMITNLEPAIALQESKYLALISAIDPELAKTKGFLPATEEVIFASLVRENLALSSKNNEI
mgnify:FL=1